MSLPHRIAAFLLVVAAFAARAEEVPRIHVDGVAAAIEAQYFDPDRGHEIAGDLRAAAAAGEFDALVDPRALAKTLTDRLRPLDRHFKVRWSPPGTRRHAMERPSPPPDAGGDDGIRKVEILPDNIGYLSMDMFADFQFGRDDQPARKAIESALQTLSGTRTMIIDLRGNRGGSPSMVGYLASAFTPRGADIYNTFHGRDGTSSEAPADWYQRPRLEVPLYVLIDARTGSAAESFSYTLKNAGRATIVGEASGGAANPGGPVDAGNGFEVFVPFGTPVSPITGTNWEGTGVAPDVAASSDAALEVALELAYKAAAKGDGIHAR